MLKKKSIKRILLFVAMLFIVSSSVFAASIRKKTVSLTKNKYDCIKISVYPGDKLKLTVKDGKKDVTDKAKYTSDVYVITREKKSAATVNKKGVITAKKAGHAIITIKYKNKSNRILLSVVKPYNGKLLKYDLGGHTLYLRKDKNVKKAKVSYDGEKMKLEVICKGDCGIIHFKIPDDYTEEDIKLIDPIVADLDSNSVEILYNKYNVKKDIWHGVFAFDITQNSYCYIHKYWMY